MIFRDRVYGMLALATGPYENLLKPDYTLSPEQLCYSVAIKSVERTGKLDFLGHLCEHQNQNLPSFIPNWTGNFTWTHDHQHKLQTLRIFTAGSDFLVKMKIISEKMISLGGVIFDTIATSAPHICDSHSSLESMQKLKFMVPTEELGLERYCHTNEIRKEAFLNTICGDTEFFDGDRSWGSWFFRRRKGPLNAMIILSLHRILDIGPSQPAIANPTESWIKQMAQELTGFKIATHNRRYFSISKGYIGLGPAKCQEGDLVVVLAGGTVPYIVRPVSPSRQKDMVAQGLGGNLNEEELLSV